MPLPRAIACAALVAVCLSGCTDPDVGSRVFACRTNDDCSAPNSCLDCPSGNKVCGTLGDEALFCEGGAPDPDATGGDADGSSEGDADTAPEPEVTDPVDGPDPGVEVSDADGGDADSEIDAPDPGPLPEWEPTLILDGGSWHVCAFDTLSGCLRCWGASSVPKLPSGGPGIHLEDVYCATPVAQIEGGFDTQMILFEDGTLNIFGGNYHDHDMLPNTPEIDTYINPDPPAVALLGVTSVDAFIWSFCAIHTDGSLTCWGQPMEEVATFPEGPFAGVSVGRANLDPFADATLGTAHACLLRTAETGGTVECFLENFSEWEVINTADAAPLTGLTQIHGARRHHCGLSEAGAVWCWGDSVHGRLGDGLEVTDGKTATRPRFADGAALDGVVQLALGFDHTCALRATGEIYCWGRNYAGQVGSGDSVIRDRPHPVTLPGDAAAMSVAAGEWHSCAVTASRQVYCWGRNKQGQLGLGNSGTDLDPTPQVPVLVGQAPAIAAGGDWVQAVAQDGRLFAWGRGLGVFPGPHAYEQHSPTLVDEGWSDLAPEERPTALHAGPCHACASGADGLWCWGQGSSDKVGTLAPTTVAALSQPEGMEQLELGLCATYVRTGTSLQMWGFGDKTLRPVPFGGEVAPAIVDISGGWGRACAVTDQGAIWCWGSFPSVEGFGEQSSTYDCPDVVGACVDQEPIPVQLEGISDAVEVAVGMAHLCYRNAAGEVRCEGDNSWGQLGTASPGFQPVSGPAFSSLEAGAFHTCGATEPDGELYCWGRNDNGQVGPEGAPPGPGVGQLEPIGTGEVGLAQLSLGFRVTCGTRPDGQPVCWGRNKEGQLGDGDIQINLPILLGEIP